MLASAAMPAWYERAFGPWYLRLYAHRDREEAFRTVAMLRPWIGEEGPVLDVACGAGRHLLALAGSGVPCFGLDRSRALLGGADPSLRDRLIRGDMRHLPFPPGAFRAVLSLFTSFGYFETDAAHRDLLREFARVTSPAGRLVLDLVNPPSLRRTLVPESTRKVEGFTVLERRHLKPREGRDRVVKEIEIRDASGTEVARFSEDVALYGREELGNLLAQAGWDETAVFGDYTGGEWSTDSPRLIAVAKRVS